MTRLVFLPPRTTGLPLAADQLDQPPGDVPAFLRHRSDRAARRDQTYAIASGQGHLRLAIRSRPNRRPEMAKGGGTGWSHRPAMSAHRLLLVDLCYFVPSFAGPDPDCLLDRNHEDLAVSDLS